MKEVKGKDFKGAIAGLGLLAIAALTFFPFDFFFLETWADGAWGDLLNQFLSPSFVKKELIANVLLFVPLGFGLGQLIQRRSLAGFRLAVAVSFMVTLGVESLQEFLPTRHSSYIDLITNTLGGALGFGAWWQFSAPLTRYQQILIRGLRRISSRGLIRQLCVLAWGAYCGWALLGSMALHSQLSSRSSPWGLSTWDATYPLLLKNEATGDRPWEGNIDNVQFYSRNLPLDEVAHLFAQPSSTLSKNIAGSQLAQFQLAHYQISGSAPYIDLSGHLSNLVWKESPSGRYLQSVSAPSSLVKAVKESQSFTLSFSFAANNNTQSGPARMLSVSIDPYHRNLTIGQVGRHLSLRLRTPITTDNGHRPEFLIPDVFSIEPSTTSSATSSAAPSPHQFVMTYDASGITAYVDSLANQHRFNFSPEATFLWQRSPPLGSSIHLSASATSFYKVLYRSLFAIPIGLLLAIATPPKLTPSRRYIFITVGILLPCVLLEMALASVPSAYAYGLVTVTVAMVVWLSGLRLRAA